MVVAGVRQFCSLSYKLSFREVAPLRATVMVNNRRSVVATTELLLLLLLLLGLRSNRSDKSSVVVHHRILLLLLWLLLLMVRMLRGKTRCLMECHRLWCKLMLLLLLWLQREIIVVARDTTTSKLLLLLLLLTNTDEIGPSRLGWCSGVGSSYWTGHGERRCHPKRLDSQIGRAHV